MFHETTYGTTPLFIASKSGNQKIKDLLVEFADKKPTRRTKKKLKPMSTGADTTQVGWVKSKGTGGGKDSEPTSGGSNEGGGGETKGEDGDSDDEWQQVRHSHNKRQQQVDARRGGIDEVMRMAANHTDSLRTAGAEDRARGGVRGEKKKGGLTTQQKADMVERARARAEEKRKNLENSVEDNMGGAKKKKERGRSRNRADDDKKKRRGSQSQSAKPRGMGSDDDAGADDGGGSGSGSGSGGEGSGSDEEGGESKGSSSPNVRRAAAASAKRRGRSQSRDPAKKDGKWVDENGGDEEAGEDTEKEGDSSGKGGGKGRKGSASFKDFLARQAEKDQAKKDKIAEGKARQRLQWHEQELMKDNQRPTSSSSVPAAPGSAGSNGTTGSGGGGVDSLVPPVPIPGGGSEPPSSSSSLRHTLGSMPTPATVNSQFDGSEPTGGSALNAARSARRSRIEKEAAAKAAAKAAGQTSARVVTVGDQLGVGDVGDGGDGAGNSEGSGKENNETALAPSADTNEVRSVTLFPSHMLPAEPCPSDVDGASSVPTVTPPHVVATTRSTFTHSHIHTFTLTHCHSRTVSLFVSIHRLCLCDSDPGPDSDSDSVYSFPSNPPPIPLLLSPVSLRLVTEAAGAAGQGIKN